VRALLVLRTYGFSQPRPWGTKREALLLAGLDVQDAWIRFKEHGDPQAREDLVLRYAYLVNITAGRVVSSPPPNLDREDLVSAGIVGLIKAVDQFDPSRNVKFETYAIALIRGAILEMLREEDWVPRSVRDRTKLLERTLLKLEARLGRPATEREMAEELDVSLDDYYRLLSDTARTSLLSLDETLLGGEGNETGVSLGETVADQTTDTYRLVERSERSRVLAEAIDRLPPRERLVISLYYRDSLTFREIGRVLEISESRAYQLHTQAILRLRGYLSTHAVLFGARDSV
jgi:RNA polymerase sigma factor for flagellar operon FliA